MSGQNKLIQSQNALEGSDIGSLREKLGGNANETAMAITKNGMKYKK